MSRDRCFAKVLRRLREEQGFANAYSFYTRRGGRKVLRLSFANYIGLERGRSLPKGGRVRVLLAALGLAPSSMGARDLVRAYFQDILGGDELLGALGAAQIDPSPPSWQVAESAARQAISQRSLQLTLEQYGVLARHEEAYACHVVLANTRAWISKRDLARTLDKTLRCIEPHLRALRGAGLAEIVGDRVRSPLAGKFLVPPVASPATSFIYSRLQGHRNKWTRSAGKVQHYRYLILRASEPKFAFYLQHLSDVVSMSAIYGDVNPAEEGSAMFLVEGRVTRLFSPGKAVKA